MTHWTAQHQTK